MSRSVPSAVRLERGDLLPEIVVPPPGPRALELCERLRRAEAPGINTLFRDQPTLLWQEALGSNVLDVDGNRYVDLTAGFGVAAIGHRHPKVVAAVREQSERLLHGLGDVHAHPLRVELAERLAALAPMADASEVQVYFAISGADAVEVALKTALLSTGRPGILAFEPSYHGLTLGALVATSRPELRAPFAEHFHRHLHRAPFAGALGEIERTLERERIGAVIVEPIVGREGILVPSAGWLAELAELARRHGALLIADEIYTGFGKTGKLWAVEHEEFEPDLLCCGKAMAGGLPIGAVLGRSDLLAHWRSEGEARHTATFVAHPLACAAALAVLEIYDEDGLVERAREEGAWLQRELCEQLGELPGLELRGRGMLAAIEVDEAERAAAVAQVCLQQGLLLLAGGPEGRVIELTPPLVATREQLGFTVEALGRLLV